jgi:hypothetical protein
MAVPEYNSIIFWAVNPSSVFIETGWDIESEPFHHFVGHTILSIKLVARGVVTLLVVQVVQHPVVIAVLAQFPEDGHKSSVDDDQGEQDKS